jgi:V/A-type H+/Na+-transporting ATPase subunit E
MSKLEEILQTEVEAEIAAILAEAETKAAKIVSEAEGRADAKVAAHRKLIDAKARAATQQAQSAAELTVANVRIQAKGEVMDLLHQKVLLVLEETSSQPNYGEVLQALAEEALRVAAGAQAVVMHPQDQEKLSEWAQQQGLEARTDPLLRLGVRIVSDSGTAVENTLPERLQRAWNTLGPRLTPLLWE